MGMVAHILLPRLSSDYKDARARTSRYGASTSKYE